MKLAQRYAQSCPEAVKSVLAGGRLVIHSVARPVGPDRAIERSGVLATFTFAADGASFVDNPVIATGVGTPGLARAYAADGDIAVADFSVGRGADIRLSEISTTPNFPIAVAAFSLEGGG
jgi:hypothetical protein